ncbi:MULTISPECIES: hypothetical protein [unclassified Streptomyces]|uniref:hypothetical protein n=1 Tax=unclassified Streptomyces TaxID=2593676 RepID=UPI0022AF276D|nr:MULTISPECIES: hypothetical protein [unclassified Streptomyces]MCZ4097301.1 hypothetical protein [Streptomyces sp. H39-C1]MCZ4120605.1 hypothetical protein [Streptomyces sp. H39-S7]
MSDDVILYGPIGRAVKEIAPYVESDPVGIYAACLSMWSMAIGDRVFLDPDLQRSPLVSTALVAGTGIGKGVALGAAQHIMAKSIGNDLELRTTSGITSGAALVDHIYRQMVKTNEAYGIEDKRVLVVEEEWREILERASRDPSFTSKIRNAWDCRVLRNTTKKKSESDAPQEVRGGRIVFHTHITPSDWRKFISYDDAAGGSYNRMLPIQLDRVPLLRHRQLPDVDTRDLVSAFAWLSNEPHVMEPNRKADYLNWIMRRAESILLASLPEHQGAFVARTAESTYRVAALLAASDGTSRIAEKHMRAAISFVGYSVRTVLDLTKDGPGKSNKKISPEERILKHLSDHPGGVRSAVLQRATGANAADLEVMKGRGLIALEVIKDGPGRPVMLYRIPRQSPRLRGGGGLPAPANPNPFLALLNVA